MKNSRIIRSLFYLVTYKHLSIVLVGIAIVLTSPSLGTGWQFDDYLHQEKLQDPNLYSATMLLFNFMTGNVEETKALIDKGIFPWWTLPEAKLMFWRPISGLTHLFDYWLWPDNAALMHVHNLFWFAFLIAIVTKFYHQFIGIGSIAGLAALLYALDDAHGLAVGWISNRNILIATLFCLFMLLAHDKWRRDKWFYGAFIAPLCLLIGLLAAEASIAVMAYLVAYVLFLEKGSWVSRCLTLIPSVVIILGWRLVYNYLGYGAWGTSYIDPFQTPWHYIQAVWERFPILLLGHWFILPAELYSFVPPQVAYLWWIMAWVFVCVGIVLIGGVLWQNQLARFWATGMLLAVLPACAALPANRLLFFIGLGGMGLLAQFLGTVWHFDDYENLQVNKFIYKPIINRLSTVFLISHLFFPFIALPITTISLALTSNVEPSIKNLPNDPLFAYQQAIIVNAPSPFHLTSLFFIRNRNRQVVPTHVRLLSTNTSAVTLQQLDAYTLIVTPQNGYLTGFDEVFRSKYYPISVNQPIELTDISITVLSLTSDGRPYSVEFRFAKPLEDNRWRWIERFLVF